MMASRVRLARQPVAADSFAGEPTSAGTSTGRTSAGSMTISAGTPSRCKTRSASARTVDALAARHVVGLAGLPPLGEEAVGLRDVGDVEEIPRHEIVAERQRPPVAGRLAARHRRT